MQIAIEYIRWLAEERAKINRVNLKDIEFFENGMKVGIPPKIIEDFELTGLNNIDFVTSRTYTGKKIMIEIKKP